MLKILFWLCAILFVTFSVVNRQEVVASLWPLPYEIIAPLSLLLFILFVFGFFAGFLSKSLQKFFSKKTT